ncbi:hypothetical protein [Cribrihabitans pelagius]|uniref:hypothetical protein n=1 Tax=Cribrihabitans pelagius TaxID=1765746 RepID=UPI003B5933E7
MADTITLTGDYGYSQYRYNGGTADAIDATDATWIVANQGSKTNNYPFLVDDAKTGIDVYGATFNGQVSLTGEWAKTYSNSAAFMVRDTEKADVSDLRISRAWDAVRFGSDSDGFEVSDVWASEIRDDVFENDHANSGTISNSLFDGVFSGLSMTHQVMPKLTSKVVTLDNVLMRMESYAFENGKTHGSPFKIEANSPSLSVHNSVLAIEDVNHIGQGRLEQAWDKMVSSSGNVFLNLSDNPLPKGYPMPGKGWTVLQGQEARDYWDAARDEWIANRGEEPAADTAGPVQPAQDLEDQAPAAGTAPADEPAIPAADSSAGSPADGPAVQADGKIVLDSTTLTGLQTGPDGEAQTLDAASFTIGGRANDSGDRIIYTFKTGELFYDEDGSGAAKQVKIAQLEDRVYYNHTDFLVSGTAEKADGSTSPSATRDAAAADGLPNDDSVAKTMGDFDPGTDQIVLKSSELTALDGQQGQDLDEASFTIAGRAGDGEDRIMYKFKTGELFYDADGTGPEAQVKIAEMDAHMYLDHSDFFVL